jgi:NAD(P)-dependent dehydrogenase (short-subunit alcohol dehydrogenase family)
MDPGVAGKLVLVTGSTAGIGKAVAAAYLKVGARVLINGRTEASVGKTIEALRAAHPDAADRLLPCIGDVGTKGESEKWFVGNRLQADTAEITLSTHQQQRGRSAEGVDAVVDQADKAGEVEVLICNVGIYGVKAFEEITDEEWIKYYEVRVDALRYVLPGCHVAYAKVGSLEIPPSASTTAPQIDTCVGRRSHSTASMCRSLHS